MKRELNGITFFRFSSCSKIEKELYYKEIFSFLRRLTWEYPSFRQWYEGLYQADYSLMASREIIICEKDYRIAGIAILKNASDEKKICTLRVDGSCQRMGIGKRLMEKSFEWLETDRPMITIHKSKENIFNPLFQYYDFRLEQKNRNYYGIFNTEFVYNGVLPEKKFWISQIKLPDMKAIYNRYIYEKRNDWNRLMEQCLNFMLVNERGYR